MLDKNYSAGMVSKVFAFVETRKTAELMNQGYTEEEIIEKVKEENIYQLRAEERKLRTYRYIKDRLNALPEEAVKMLPTLDADNAKILVLIGVMKTDQLFFEFVYEVYRNKVILGENTIDNRDLNQFFDDKINQSEKVRSWSESGIKKLKNCYIKNLVDAGLMESAKSRIIKVPLVDYRIQELLKKNDMDVYLAAVKGDR